MHPWGHQLNLTTALAWPSETNWQQQTFICSDSQLQLLTIMDQILEQVREVTEGQIDFEGQKLAELLVNISLSLIGAISFIVGYFLQDIKLALYIALGGSALVFVLVVPAWPFFNQHPVKWLPVGGGTQMQMGNLALDEKAI